MGQMACWLTENAKEQQRWHSKIERELRRDKSTWRKEVKLLLLGTAEAGKSTFIKQMRIIHGHGYSEEEARAFTLTVYKNLLRPMLILVEALEDLRINTDPDNAINISLIRDMDPEISVTLEPDISEAWRSIWSDPGMKECFDRRHEFQLPDWSKYFLENFERIASPDYIPTLQDILRARTTTCGIVDYNFVMDSTAFRIVDVGGQRSERRKWIYCFESVTSIIFLVALNDYDQLVERITNENRMEESVLLFRTIINEPCLSNSSVILFLNKKDLLKEKVLYSDLKDYFPTFTGPVKDATAAGRFVQMMYLEQNAVKYREIYSHFTCATDTENIRIVFAAVKDTILQANLKEYNMV